jgi:imidazoleglycerol-phosphate dehydratase
LEHFLESFAHQLGANIIVTVRRDSAADLHTVMETIFKSLGIALDQATFIDPRRDGKVPSTKGIID